MIDFLMSEEGIKIAFSILAVCIAYFVKRIFDKAMPEGIVKRILLYNPLKAISYTDKKRNRD